MTIGEKIKALRIQKGYTLEELGNIVGVGKSTVRKWETGDIVNMRRDKIGKLANALGVEPDYIINLDSDVQPIPENELNKDLAKALASLDESEIPAVLAFVDLLKRQRKE